MNIAIIGAGALGTYFGARWMEAGANVTFVVREKRKKQIEENGLYVRSLCGDTTINDPKITADPSSVKNIDIIVLAVKGYHLESVLPTLEKMTGENTYILPILNGLAHYDLLIRCFGKDKVLGGLANIIATLNEKGHVEHTSKLHEIRFGALASSQQQICERLAELSNRSNMDAKHSKKIKTDLWYKYMFITAFSGITAAADVSIGKVRQHPATMEIVKGLLQEMHSIARAEDDVLEEKHLERAIETMMNLHDNATSSMHQDLRKGLAIELEHLHGYALGLAEIHEMDVPFLKTIYGIVKAKS
ncbi:2-dehydropantoate 2-reductase [Gracilibacillus ureilyticus]|uniref:2-dehydropantoate 2-reductase n=1 Tax=Gracilibacillus ureilyticus TaxID=531814 RepID=A0A1H9S799_9BACI|nr:ketopantoate reductase family protein [Gracilibacillus ureilyticus]SER80867.1 2-dehydropantoate 2-reductase [Gracilibacillus ureilyticus]